jgi:MFS family permease
MALPFLLIYTLSATAMDVAWVRVAEIAPGIVLGMAAGMVVDRVPRRKLLLLTDVGRTLVAFGIPVLLITRHLTLSLVIIAAGLLSIASTAFAAAFDAYLPVLVPEEVLLKANAAFSALGAVAEVAGFGVAGILFDWLHAAAAFTVDAASFMVSALSLALIRQREPRRPSSDTDALDGHRLSMAEGFHWLKRQPLVARLAVLDCVNSIFFGVSGAVYMLYISRTLHVAPAVQGILYAAGGAASLVTAGAAQRLVGRFGRYRALVGGALAAALGTLVLTLAVGPLWLIALFILGQQVLGDGGDTMLDIGMASLRQSFTENAVPGRVRSSWLVMTGLGLLAGTLMGGELGRSIGYRYALVCGAAVRLVVAVIAWSSRVSMSAAATPGSMPPSA